MGESLDTVDVGGIVDNHTATQTYDVCPSGCVYTSIQDAINNSESGDTIQISPGEFYEHLTIINSDFFTTKELTLVGAGEDLTVVDGSSKDIVLWVGTNISITVSGMSIQNGVTPGYYDGESWQKEDNAFYKNEGVDTNFEFLTGDPPSALVSYSNGHGSMLYWLGQSFTTPEDATPQPIIGFRFLKADGITPTGAGSGYLLEGSAAYYNIEEIPELSIAAGNWNGSYYDLYDSSGSRLVTEPGQRYLFISLSDTAFEIGITSIRSNPGAGVVNYGELKLQGVHVKNNESLTAGGGIWNSGKLIIEDCVVSGNKAVRGGGIFIEDAPSSPIPGDETPIVTITNSIINNNTADGGGLTGTGGGIRVGQNRELKVYESTISENSAVLGGGIEANGSWGTVDTYIENSSITDNFAMIGGGGVFNFNGTMTISSSTIQSNTAKHMGGGLVNSPDPYGISNLYLVDSTVSYNEVTNALIEFDGGGGLYNGGAFPDQKLRTELAIARIENSTIHHNITNAKSGGGIKTTSCTTLISNSTISGNSAPQGGGIAFEVYFYDSARCFHEPSLDISYSTIADNSGGGIYHYEIFSSTLELEYTIIGLNNGYDCNGKITSWGGNMDSDNTCTLSLGSDIQGTNPMLGPLQDNGGQTWTHKPLSGSPVIDPFFSGYPGGELYLGGKEEFILWEDGDVDFQVLNKPGSSNILLENLIGLGDRFGIVGQSFSIPSDATELELSGFRFMLSDNLTPSGSGMGYLFTGEYNGAPDELINADYVASAPWDGANSLYDFSGSDFTFTPGEKYWFYTDSPVTAGLSSLPFCNTNIDQRHIIRPLDGDGDGTAVCDIGSVEISVPIADTGGPYSGTEGEPIALDGTGSSDPDGDPLTFNWSVDSYLCSFDDSTLANPSINCLDNGEYSVTLLVSDGDATSSDTTIVTVDNVAPTIEAISVPSDPVSVGSPIDFTITFTDPGLLDTHDILWNWGDESSNKVLDVTSPFSMSHTYEGAGIYTITATVTDKDGGSTTAISEYIVVYDPDGGFVTGGGWIMSPAGAYAPDPSLTGKANFGFVSKYKKGANVPTGNTEFQFKAGDLNFHSSSYDWLVVTGADYARFKGSGTINGELAPNGEEYKFMIWAGDGTGDNGDDTFRIKIWYEVEDVEVEVYDNSMDQEIGGGSIVVKTK
jgi:PKD repeat protein